MSLFLFCLGAFFTPIWELYLAYALPWLFAHGHFPYLSNGDMTVYDFSLRLSKMPYT